MSFDNLTDEALVERFFLGCEESFFQIVSRYESKVFNSALFLTNYVEDAEQVLEQVFIGLEKKLSEDKGKTALFQWLVKETLNVAVFRLVGKREEEDSSVQRLTSDVQVQTRFFAKRNQQTLHLFHDAVKDLPRDVRAVFLLLDVLALDRKEVCGTLGLSEFEVRAKLQRARRALKLALAEAGKSKLSNAPVEGDVMCSLLHA